MYFGERDENKFEDFRKETLEGNLQDQKNADRWCYKMDLRVFGYSKLKENVIQDRRK